MAPGSRPDKRKGLLVADSISEETVIQTLEGCLLIHTGQRLVEGLAKQ